MSFIIWFCHLMRNFSFWIFLGFQYFCDSILTWNQDWNFFIHWELCFIIWFWHLIRNFSFWIFLGFQYFCDLILTWNQDWNFFIHWELWSNQCVKSYIKSFFDGPIRFANICFACLFFHLMYMYVKGNIIFFCICINTQSTVKKLKPICGCT